MKRRTFLKLAAGAIAGAATGVQLTSQPAPGLTAADFRRARDILSRAPRFVGNISDIIVPEVFLPYAIEATAQPSAAWEAGLIG